MTRVSSSIRRTRRTASCSGVSAPPTFCAKQNRLVTALKQKAQRDDSVGELSLSIPIGVSAVQLRAARRTRRGSPSVTLAAGNHWQLLPETPREQKRVQIQRDDQKLSHGSLRLGCEWVT